jgi:hypothetical protein
MTGHVRQALADRELALGPGGVDSRFENWRLHRDVDGIAWLIVDISRGEAPTRFLRRC